MKNKRRSLSKTSKFFLHALLVLYSIVLTRVTCSGGGLAEYRESRIKRNPVLDQRTKTRENREVYQSRRRSGYPDMGISHETPDEKGTVNSQENYNRQSAATGSVYHSSNYPRIDCRDKQASSSMNANYRPVDGLSFTGEAKKILSVIRKSSHDNSLKAITEELHGFLKNNWLVEGSNWSGYYFDISIKAYIGSTVANLPEQHEIIKIKDLTYYYAGGIYYTKFRKACVVVPPPYGAVIGAMPVKYTTVYIGESAYFNCGGVFYIKVGKGYQVVVPPVGAIVNELPRGAYSTLIHNNVYSVYGTAYYKRFFRGNSVIYKIVKAPTEKKAYN